MRIHRSVSPRRMRSPAVGPWRPACSSRLDRRGHQRPRRRRRRRGRPRGSRPGAQRTESPAGRSRRNPSRLIAVELERGVHLPERVVRRDPDGPHVRRWSPRSCVVPDRGPTRTSPSANRMPPGPSGVARPNGCGTTSRRVPSSSRTSTRISGTRSATPSITWSGATALGPPSSPRRSSRRHGPPCAVRRTRARWLPGTLRGSPRSSVRRASSATVKTRSRSSSVGFRSSPSRRRSSSWRRPRRSHRRAAGRAATALSANSVSSSITVEIGRDLGPEHGTERAEDVHRPR